MAHQFLLVSYLPLALFFFIFSILRVLIRVFSRLANYFVLLAQGLERGSYEPDVTGSIPVWDTFLLFFFPFLFLLLSFSVSFFFIPSLFFSFFLFSSHWVGPTKISGQVKVFWA